MVLITPWLESEGQLLYMKEMSAGQKANDVGGGSRDANHALCLFRRARQCSNEVT